MDSDLTQFPTSKSHASLYSKGLNSNMQIRFACVEDGLENMGFRKFSGYVKSLYPNTKVTYVPTGNLRSVIRTLTEKGAGELSEDDMYKVAQFLAKGNIVGISSMTQYSETVH